MARFRVETVEHIPTGRYYVELYYPDYVAEPTAKTDPIYNTHEEAEKDVLQIFNKWMDKIGK